MSKKAVFCIASSESQASEIVSQLKAASFSNNDISALLPDKTGTKDFAFEHHSRVWEKAAVGGLIVGLLCAGAGWIVGLGLIAVPTLAPFLLSGPIVAALSAAAEGALAGGIVGALAGLAAPVYEAKRYAGKVREGNILISVHCETRAGARRARQIFRKAGAHDIAAGREKAITESLALQPSLPAARDGLPA